MSDIKYINNFLKELFYTITGALVIFVFLEIISPGIVLAYININYILLSWLMVGLLIITKSTPSNDSVKGAITK